MLKYCPLKRWWLLRNPRALYSHTGQPSLGPFVFFKLVLVGWLENLVSERRQVAHCALRLDSLFFLGYEVDEELPGHLTVYSTKVFSQYKPSPSRCSAIEPPKPSSATAKVVP